MKTKRIVIALAIATCVFSLPALAADAYDYRVTCKAYRLLQNTGEGTSDDRAVAKPVASDQRPVISARMRDRKEAGLVFPLIDKSERIDRRTP